MPLPLKISRFNNLIFNLKLDIRLLNEGLKNRLNKRFNGGLYNRELIIEKRREYVIKGVVIGRN